MKRYLLLLPLLTLLGASAEADSQAGEAAFERGDYANAYRELRPLAEQGGAGAQHYLGTMYATGRGVPQNIAKAVKWYRKAADQGYADALSSLAWMYVSGSGVPQDYAEAAKWYRRAAEQGDAIAQSSLGVMYVLGWGVPQDYVQAHKWFDLAAAHDLEDANKSRDRVAGRMTPAQLAEAQRLTSEWLERRSSAN